MILRPFSAGPKRAGPAFGGRMTTKIIASRGIFFFHMPFTHGKEEGILKQIVSGYNFQVSWVRQHSSRESSGNLGNKTILGIVTRGACNITYGSFGIYLSEGA
jgi:hypothetical protein